jgi:hypothetical protein
VSRRGLIRLRRLAAILRLDEHQVGELTRRGRLPFSVTTIDGLHINPTDVAAWRIAARRRRRR